VFRFEDGTLPFLEILAVKHGFDALYDIAGLFIFSSYNSDKLQSLIRLITTVCTTTKTVCELVMSNMYLFSFGNRSVGI